MCMCSSDVSVFGWWHLGLLVNCLWFQMHLSLVCKIRFPTRYHFSGIPSGLSYLSLKVYSVHLFTRCQIQNTWVVSGLKVTLLALVGNTLVELSTRTVTQASRLWSQCLCFQITVHIVVWLQTNNRERRLISNPTQKWIPYKEYTVTNT